MIKRYTGFLMQCACKGAFSAIGTSYYYNFAVLHRIKSLRKLAVIKLCIKAVLF